MSANNDQMEELVMLLETCERDGCDREAQDEVDGVQLCASHASAALQEQDK